MKKVLLVTHSLSVGGVSTSLINVSSVLHKYGYNITIVSTSDKYDEAILRELEPISCVHIREEKKYPLLSKIKYIKNFYESGCWFTRKKARYLYTWFIPKGEYDFEIAFYIGRPAKVIAGSPNRNSKKILWLRTDFILNSGVFAGFSNKTEAIKAFEIFDTLIAVSSQVKEGFEKSTGINHKINLLHNFIDIKSIDVKIKEACNIKKIGFTIIFVGRLVKEKGVWELLKAFERLQTENLNVSLWLIGGGILREELDRYISDNNIRNITFIGEVNNPLKYVHMADLYVCASHIEGFPNTIAESIAVGTPVVSTNCSGARDILGNSEYGLIVDNTSYEELFLGIKQMLLNKDKYQFYKEKAAERISFFDWNKTEERLIQILEE